ncbi:MAG: tetratricopeptide repeat protein [Treponema sp.]|nr:tetratricopeptide repeat protein [Treponema sp.]
MARIARALAFAIALALLASCGGGGAAGNAFARELARFDAFDAPGRVLAGGNPARIERRLSRLERRAQSMGEYLSVLKRHRALALLDSRYITGYERAAREAAQAFPFSAPLAAVAAEALALDGSPQSLALLEAYAGRLAQPGFGHLALAAHSLAGNLDDPAQAAGVLGLETLLWRDLPGTLSAAARQRLHVNEFLLRAAGGDVSGASFRLNALLLDSAGTDIQRMAAEFFYDHDNPRRAAELFARLAEDYDQDISRLADALVLAGEIPGARNIWFALSADLNWSGPSGGGLSRYLYNMASSSADGQEEALWLQRLFSYRAQRGRDPADGIGVYSVIRYTRLLDTGRGTAVLEEEGMGRHPLAELELLRRRLDGWPPGRASAEVWLLLNRHSADPAIYEWAAWYFEHQRLYPEIARLLNDAAREGMSGAWLDLHRALAFMREGDSGEGERLLREAGARSRNWRFFANLGRVYESRGEVLAALQAYETAAALVPGQRPAEAAAAAQVQLRLSRTLEALGRIHESRAALERALELDPDNLNIRHELWRFDVR